MDWIAESQENNTKQAKGNDVLCYRLLHVSDLTTSKTVFVSSSIVIHDLEDAFTCLIMSESCKHVTEKGQAKIYLHGSYGETEAQNYSVMWLGTWLVRDNTMPKT